MEINQSEVEQRIRLAARQIAQADALLIGAGAGMGVDSGLPDFRGNEGFWKAYPPFRGRIFAEMSNPTWFKRDPELAWGFFGHRYNLYRNAVPHVGYHILRRWAESKPRGGFVWTSNVDGQFVKAGFDPLRLVECHGSIHRLQCFAGCEENTIWEPKDLKVEVDLETIRATSALPRCPRCEALARPNILMFGDWGWNSRVTDEQTHRMSEWLESIQPCSIVAVECGAGLAIPTVRNACEEMSHYLIRINPRDYQTPDNGVGIPLGAAEALSRIDALLTSS